MIVVPAPMVTGPSSIAFTLSATTAFEVVVFGVAQAPANVNVPELNTATFAIPSEAIVTGPSVLLTQTLLVPLKILSELALIPVSWLPLPKKYDPAPAVIFPTAENAPAVDTFPVVSIANALASTGVLVASTMSICNSDPRMV